MTFFTWMMRNHKGDATPAGDLAAEELSEYSMLPTDIISKVPLVIKQILNNKREGLDDE